VTFEQLQKANAQIRTTGIEKTDKKTGEKKVTQYAEVNERIKAFRMIYPDGLISTEVVSLENGVCVMRATVANEDGNILGTGTAYEKENSTFINKTSYIENCETSAVGRALGMAGFGIDTSVASYEEVTNAIHQQEAEKEKYKTFDITEAQASFFDAYQDKDRIANMLKYYKVNSVLDLTEAQAKEAIERLKK
jgi:hypothetical protein